METLIGSDAEYEEQRKKYMAKQAVDTILAAEQHKKDKDLKPHIDSEMKERHGHLKAAMSGDKKKEKTKKEPKKVSKKALPEKKSSKKK